MTRFRRQFFFGLFALIAATAGALWLNGKFNALPNYAYLTGWALLAGINLNNLDALAKWLKL